MRFGTTQYASISQLHGARCPTFAAAAASRCSCRAPFAMAPRILATPVDCPGGSASHLPHYLPSCPAALQIKILSALANAPQEINGQLLRNNVIGLREIVRSGSHKANNYKGSIYMVSGGAKHWCIDRVAPGSLGSRSGLAARQCKCDGPRAAGLAGTNSDVALANQPLALLACRSLTTWTTT